MRQTISQHESMVSCRIKRFQRNPSIANRESHDLGHHSLLDPHLGNPGSSLRCYGTTIEPWKEPRKRPSSSLAAPSKLPQLVSC